MAGLVVHDFDEVGVPSGADKGWRQRSLEQWVRRAVEYQRDGFDMLLLGQSPLGEVLASPSAVELDGIATCVLDVADDERRRRLEQRDAGKWSDQARDAFVGWARWHRGHAVDPRHMPAVITEGSWAGMRWERWSDWRAGDQRWTVPILDTSDIRVEQASAALLRWVTEARTARPANPVRA
ncbi:hypothetical protein M1L60_28020 [Actinoplanes sp. TRM 88003]|uniref:Uncharacterized protein n=1 Tax=Paractinoplanes aksuensis TaxID=2939490 RepID=A0ABT1DWW8_9ACTN|nr:hypothetical protein [Actinoplanes aksuensis]MCO8274450.1 hypothetical protein [Actinoplanes aksuensis]